MYQLIDKIYFVKLTSGSDFWSSDSILYDIHSPDETLCPIYYGFGGKLHIGQSLDCVFNQAVNVRCIKDNDSE